MIQEIQAKTLLSSVRGEDDVFGMRYNFSRGLCPNHHRLGLMQRMPRYEPAAQQPALF